MKTDYTPTIGEVKNAYQSLVERCTCPEEGLEWTSLVDPDTSFDRWLSELIRKEREEAWVEGFDRGFYRGQVLPGDRDACEAGVENPYQKE